jgi:hypothetical protein
LSSGPIEDEALDALISAADLDGLIRLVDARCASRDWAGLFHLRERSRWAVSTGRQLWPAATLAEYRLALLAPADWAAKVLDEGSGRFSIGPLTEVIAQSHSWESLAPLLGNDPRAAFVAHERVLRGERVDQGDLPDVLELPFALQPWEPTYPLAVYEPNGSTFAAPEVPTGLAAATPEAAVKVDDDAVTLAFRQLVEPWTAESNGQADVVCVEGVAADAVGALGIKRLRLAPLEPAQALAWLAWAGASGGAMGRRRGGAMGRFGAWWVVAALGDALDDWPLPPDELGRLAHELQWYWWDANEPALGWELQIAVELPAEGLAWALTARDAV